MVDLHIQDKTQFQRLAFKRRGAQGCRILNSRVITRPPPPPPQLCPADYRSSFTGGRRALADLAGKPCNSEWAGQDA